MGRDDIYAGAVIVLAVAALALTFAPQSGRDGVLVCDWNGLIVMEVTDYRHRDTWHEYRVQGDYGATDHYCIFEEGEARELLQYAEMLMMGRALRDQRSSLPDRDEA